MCQGWSYKILNKLNFNAQSFSSIYFVTYLSLYIYRYIPIRCKWYIIYNPNLYFARALMHETFLYKNNVAHLIIIFAKQFPLRTEEVFKIRYFPCPTKFTKNPFALLWVCHSVGTCIGHRFLCIFSYVDNCLRFNF